MACTRLLYGASALALLTAVPAVGAEDYHVVRMTQPQPNGLGSNVSPTHLPVEALFAPGNTDTMFVVQLGGNGNDGSDGDDITKLEGRVVLYDTNTGLVDFNNPFLVINDTNTSNPFGIDEIGLFSMAFHPDFQTNGKFYVNVAVNHQGPPPTVDFRTSPFKTAVREYVADSSNLAAGATFSKTIFELDQPAANHNGSWIGFNPVEAAEGKNYLYITQGDGGDQHDPASYGQNRESWFGTVMRVDIDGDDFASSTLNYAIPDDNPFAGGASAADDEVFAYGLRNPWRASFDSATGDLYIGDVGQGSWEEVNIIPNGASGQNFGWRLREGFVATPSGGVGGPQPVGGVDPALAYPHGFASFNGNSITGGIVYRGPAPSLQGKYIFADNVSGNVWAIDLDDLDSFDPANPGATMVRLNPTLIPDQGTITSIVSFGEDPDGNLLLVDYFGDIFRLEPFFSPGDLNSDFQVDEQDLAIILANWGGGVPPGSLLDGDPDGDGAVGIADADLVLANWTGSNPPPIVIPEPASAAVLLVLGGLVGRRRRFA